ncbi:MAG: translocation/assembly module TamB domain-containing protein [Gemmatimonadales bacterium]|nr:translocation/assembly module TamB domain-containing protein [Gemmatimonadales bacterium]
MGVVVLLLGLLQVPTIATWAAERLLTLVPLNPEYTLDVGRVSGNWITRLRAENVVLRHRGQKIALVRRLTAQYDPRDLMGSRRRLEELVVDGGSVAARRGPEGWNLASAFRTSEDTSTGGGGFAIDELRIREIQATAAVAPDSMYRVRALMLNGGDFVMGDTLLLRMDTLHLSLAPPGDSPWFEVAASGAVTPEVFRLDPLRIESRRSLIEGNLVLPRNFDDPRLVRRLDVRLKAMPLALADVSAVYPPVPAEGYLRAEIVAGGEGRMVTAQLAARLGEATMSFQGGTVMGSDAPAVIRLRGEVNRLDPSLLHEAAPAGSVTGELEADLRGETLALASGSASVSLRGTRVGATELRRLDLAADVRQGRAEVELRSELLGGTVRTDGWIRPFDSVPSYRLNGRVVGLDGTEAVARTLTGEGGQPELALAFRVAGEGVTPDAADLQGRVSLSAIGGENGTVPLGGASLELEAGRLELRPELLVAGGRVRGLASVGLGETITYQVRRGIIDSVDVGRLLGDTVAAPLSARFTLEGQGVDPQETVVTARLEMDELRYAGRQVEQLIANVRITGGRATMDVRSLLQGGRLALDAVARPFDSVTTFEVRRASLDSVDLGTLLGRPDLAGPVTVGGTARGRWGGATRSLRGRIDIAPSRLGTIQVAGGEVDAGLAGERMTYDGSLHTSGGSFAIAGDGLPLAEVPSFTARRGRVDSLDVGLLLGRDSLETALNARFSGALTGSGLDNMLARLDLSLLPSRVNRAELSSGRLEVSLEAGRLRGDLDLEGEDAAIDATLTGTVGGAGWRVRTEGDLRVEHLARWAGTDGPDGRVEGRFALTGSVDTAGFRSLAGTMTAAGGVGQVRVQRFHVALEPSPGALRVDTLVLRSNVAAIDGGGSLALNGSGTPAADTLRITGQARDASPLAALAGLDSLFLDSASVALTVTGPPGRWRVNGRADAFRLLYQNNLANRITARGTTTIDSGGLGGVAGSVRIQGAAIGKVTLEEVQLAGRYDSLALLEATVRLDDAMSLALGLHGRVMGDTVRAVLRRLQLIEDSRTWELARPVNLTAQPGSYAVDDLVLAAGGQRIAVDGVVSTRDSSDLTVRIDQLSLDALARAHVVPVAGTLNGAFRLSGPASAPSMVGRIGFAARSDDGRSAGQVKSDIEWDPAGLRLEASATSRRGGRLTVDGTLPWRLTLTPEDTSAMIGVANAAADTMALAVRADRFDLGFFQPFLPEAIARGLTGALLMDARVRGTPAQPAAQGSVNVRGLEVTLPTIGVTYSGGRLNARLQGERLVVDTLLLTTGGDQRLLATGTVLLEPLGNPSLDLTARLDKFRISNSETLRALGTGVLHLEGTLAEPTLAGSLQLGPSEIIAAGEAGAEGAVEEVQLSQADLLNVVQRFGPGALAGLRESPGLVDRFRLDIDVQFPRQVWFRKPSSPSIDIELAGRIEIRQQPGEEMQFFGSVRPIPGRGEMNLYGRRFEIVEGDIVLQGPTEATTLDVTAQYQVPTQGGPDDEEVLIFVEAQGRLDSLELEFTAEPSMSNEDIISYIVTGRPASDNPLLAAGAGGGVDASRVAINQLVGTLGGAVGEELGFDVFQIRQEANRGLVLTAGRYLLPRLYVSLQQPLRIGPTAEQQVTGASGPGFELEYALRSWLRGTLRGGSLPTSVLLRGRYGF